MFLDNGSILSSQALLLKLEAILVCVLFDLKQWELSAGESPQSETQLSAWTAAAMAVVVAVG